MGALFELNLRADGFEDVERALGRLDPINGAMLLEGLARAVQEQTRHRIKTEKRGPDGAGWKPNRAGTSTLLRSEKLAQTLSYVVTGDGATIGSGRIYAGVHQHGATITAKKARRLAFRVGNQMIFRRQVTIPARPFLGISDANARHLLDATARFLRNLLGG